MELPSVERPLPMRHCWRPSGRRSLQPSAPKQLWSEALLFACCAAARVHRASYEACRMQHTVFTKHTNQ
eukprot:1618267-Alexandrium_andersonii.AAC.1